MSEHTPGPWAWRKISNGAVLWGEHGKRPVVLDCGRTRDADSFVLRGRDAEHDLMVPLDIESADARLIEAAPDTLAACEAIQGFEGSMGTLARFKEIMEQVDAAVKKAHREKEGDDG